MTQVWLTGIGVLGAGLPNWRAAREVLLGRARYADAPDPDPLPALLPPNERRRCPATARWALAVGGEALAASGIAPENVAIVFTSCGGDGQNTHQICEGLAARPPLMSPTRFLNSVHNAPAGYWSIFARCRAPSTTLSANDASFSAGLLEAAAQVAVEQRHVLLVAYDLPYPAPMRALWPVMRPFAAALLLAPAASGEFARKLNIELAAGAGGTAWPESLPGDLASNPAARALIVLGLAARDEGGRAKLRCLKKSHLAIEIDP